MEEKQMTSASHEPSLAFLLKGNYSCCRTVCDKPYGGDDDIAVRDELLKALAVCAGTG